MTTKPILLVVDGDRDNLELTTRYLGQEGYDTRGIASLADMQEVAGEEEKIALALIYLSVSDKNVWERCAELQQAGIPFLIISPQRSPSVQKNSLKCGARGVLIKPVALKELLVHIRTLTGEQ
ncbi:MAG: response regulator [Dehalococcoidia bacterium]|nr:response regulator [Dehalococcoidia bacterium]MDZ4246542.1 response regulator [Dehalococcoidia bacterium]